MFPRALFLDRDGTLIEDRHYLADPAGVVLLPGVKETLHGFLKRGCRLFLFTNQSGVGRGLFPLAAVHRCNERMFALLELPSPGFTEVCLATEAPETAGGYRKPSPRFILEMITRHALDPDTVWMVGDRLNDVQAGVNAGVRSALLTTDESVAVPPGVWSCRNLAEFQARFSTES